MSIVMAPEKRQAERESGEFQKGTQVERIWDGERECVRACACECVRE